MFPRRRLSKTNIIRDQMYQIDLDWFKLFRASCLQFARVGLLIDDSKAKAF